MASFAKIGTENIIEQVISINNSVITDVNGVEQEAIGIEFLRTLYNEPNTIWKQTSYNTHGGVHSKGGISFRKNYAGIGYKYDSQRDAFIPQKLYNSWILNEDTCLWESPIPKPDNENQYIWNEETQSWTLQTI